MAKGLAAPEISKQSLSTGSDLSSPKFACQYSRQNVSVFSDLTEEQRNGTVLFKSFVHK